MNRLADLILSHKRLVIAFWAVVTIAAFAAVGPAGDSLSQQFNIPGREGYETNKDIAEIYGSGGDVAPLVPVVTLPKGTTVDSPGVTAELASALARVKQAMPDVRIASYASTHDRSFVSDDGRTTFALVYHPAVGGVDPGQAEARKAQAALAGVTVAGSPVEVTGMNALRAAPADSDSGGTGMLVETLLGALGALLVLIFVFRSFMAIVPLLMAAVAIPTTFLLIWPIANVTDVSVIVQFLVALIGLGIAIDYALLVVVRWREERRGGEVANETAVRNAMRHAGSAVVFSGTTVAISLLSLLALPMPALRSIGIAGLLIALVSVAVANTLLPVVLATVGPWLDRPRSNRDQSASRAWSAWARIVVRHRWIAASASTAVLAALVLAASQIQLGDPQADSLAQKGPARVGLEQLKDCRHRHRAAVTVRSPRPLRQPRKRRRRDREDRRHPDDRRPGRLAPRRHRDRHDHPDAGRQLGGRPSHPRPDPLRRHRRRDRRRRSGSERRLPRRRLRQLPADDPRDQRPHLHPPRPRLPLDRSCRSRPSSSTSSRSQPRGD